MSEEKLKQMREEYCVAHGLKYFGLYMMPQVALVLTGTDDTTSVKRWKKEGRLKWVKHGKDGVRFFGWQIAAFHVDNIVEVEAAWNGVERRSRQQSFEGIEKRKA